MRTVKKFSLGSRMPSFAPEYLIVVGFDGVFSHCHYVAEYPYPNEDHRVLYDDTYNAHKIERKILARMAPSRWRTRAIQDLLEVGCYSGVGFEKSTSMLDVDGNPIYIEEFPETPEKGVIVRIYLDFENAREFPFSSLEDAHTFIGILSNPKFFSN